MLLKPVTLQVKIGNNMVRVVTITVGVPQGDCLSLIHPSKDQPVVIDQQYSDDIVWISTSKYKTNRLKKETPQMFKRRNQQINGPKTEDYNMERGGDESWKKCKYVGSLIDTEQDIKQRKQLSMVSYI